MKCDHCQNEASVQETIIQAGKVLQRHLCEQCARSFGVKIGSAGAAQIAQVLTQAVMAQTVGGQAAKEQIRAASAAACGSCGLSYNTFRQSGMLGCPDCYRAFEAQLGPLLERAHEGGTHHIGKLPKRARTDQPASPSGSTERAAALFRTPEERSKRLIILRKQLAEAIAAEQYERAASLRDELRRIALPSDEGAR